jgi:hypothetical protein
MITLQNLLPASSALPTQGNHAKIRSGELSLLMALSELQKQTDYIQKSLAEINIYIADTVIPDLAKANQAKLQTDQTNMEAYANGSSFFFGISIPNKDLSGFGQAMIGLEGNYANDKKNCQNAIDQRTVKTSTLSDTVTSISKDTSATSTTEQNTLNETSNILDLVLSFLA